MLNGVGGRTIAEAKWRMTYAEARDWASYMERRGTLHLGMRVEAGFALLATQINRALGGHANMKDFMPHVSRPVEDLSRPATAQEIMNILSGAE